MVITSIVAVAEELDDVGMAEVEEDVKLLLEDLVEALAAAVDLDGGGRGAAESGEVDGAEAAVANDGGVIRRQPLQVFPG